MLRDVKWQDGDFVLDGGGRLAFVTDADVVRQDLIARLISPPGSHWAHPLEGLDLVRFVLGAARDDLSLLEMRQEVELETARDDRVRRATAQVAQPTLDRTDVRVTAQLTDGALIQFGLAIGSDA